MSDTDHRSPVTIEDLLRLKRAERPSPEFWVRFERELREKQLAALLERRPWWQSLPQLLRQPRAFMPIGATAVLALTLVSTRFYGPVQMTEAKPVGSESLAQPVPATVVAAASPAAVLSAPTESPVLVAEAPAISQPDLVAEASLSEHLPDRATEIAPWGASPSSRSPARFFVANLESAEQPAQVVVEPAFQSPVALPVAALKPQRATEASAELASVSEQTSKRSRLMAQFSERQFTPEPQAPASVRERLTRRLAFADTGLADHISRVGLKGDQVSLRF